MKTIAGKWTIESFSGFEWEFIEFSRNGPIGKGMLVEFIDGCPSNVTTYLFDCQNRKLTVDRSDVEPDGFVTTCYEEHHRVERVSKNEIRLVSGDDS